MKIQAIKCDICGRIKGESNNWLKMLVRGKTILIETSESDLDLNNLDICSNECFQKAFSKALEVLRDAK